jgi:hypothetical protein
MAVKQKQKMKMKIIQMRLYNYDTVKLISDEGKPETTRKFTGRFP